MTEQKRKRTLADKFRRAVTQLTLPYPGRFRLAAITGKIGQTVCRTAAEVAACDARPACRQSLPAKQTWEEINPAIGSKRGRVALLVGCAQSVLDPDINTATIDVLTRNGVEVIVPTSQACCGALSWHVGNHRQAQAFAKTESGAFPGDVDAIVTNAAGCGSGMHEYNLILKGTGDEQRALQFCQQSL